MGWRTVGVGRAWQAARLACATCAGVGAAAAWGLADAGVGAGGGAVHAAGSPRAELPEYRADDVARRNGGPAAAGRVWVTYRRGVYDITDFVRAHPGGDQILLAAGGPLEPYWALYAQHDADYVREILEEMRVGNLAAEDADRVAAAARARAKAPSGVGDLTSPGDPYINDPPRHPALLVRSERPFNAEPPPGLLVATQRTPNQVFYVRNHLPVPHIDPASYSLEVAGVDGNVARTYTLEQLRTRFKKYSVDATLQCAGNRRDEMSAVRPVKGGSWDRMAVGNAQWAGVRLRDVLADAGLHVPEFGDTPDASPKDKHDPSLPPAPRHVTFDGLDADPATGKSYGASVPLDVVQRVPDVLLAYEMNGEPLPPDHGFPLRAIVPGVVGARNVKWLKRVTLSTNESESHWQTHDYKGFCPSVDWDSVDFSKAPAIQELPVVSAICSVAPRDGGSVTVSGYAWSGDGKGIVRVDVSGDGGHTWQTAELLPRNELDVLEDNEVRRSRVYDWTLWTADIVPTGSTEDIVLTCKAVDSSYQTQPERVESIWNLRGVLNSSWHRVSIERKCTDKGPESEATAAA